MAARSAGVRTADAAPGEPWRADGFAEVVGRADTVGRRAVADRVAARVAEAAERFGAVRFVAVDAERRVRLVVVARPVGRRDGVAVRAGFTLAWSRPLT